MAGAAPPRRAGRSSRPESTVPVTPTTSPARRRRREVVDPTAADAGDLDRSVPVGRGGYWPIRSPGAPSRPSTSRVRAASSSVRDRDARLDDPSVAERGDPVSQRQDLLEVVADEQHRRALLGHEADHVVERRQRLVRDRPRGLVEDDDAAAGLAILQRAGDSDRDPLARGQGGDGGLGVDRDAEELEGPAHGGVVGGRVDPAGEAADGVEADPDVVPDGEVVHEARGPGGRRPGPGGAGGRR